MIVQVRDCKTPCSLLPCCVFHTFQVSCAGVVPGDLQWRSQRSSWKRPECQIGGIQLRFCLPYYLQFMSFIWENTHIVFKCLQICLSLNMRDFWCCFRTRNSNPKFSIIIALSLLIPEMKTRGWLDIEKLPKGVIGMNRFYKSEHGVLLIVPRGQEITRIGMSAEEKLQMNAMLPC